MDYKYQQELDIYVEAQEAAATAAQQMIDENPGTWFPCGFSWVKVKPARGRFVSMCKDKDFGRTDDYDGGFQIYNPSGNSTQWMDAKMAGCRAFVAVMKKHYPEMRIYAVERID
jgi:hypothetical protein